MPHPCNAAGQISESRQMMSRHVGKWPPDFMPCSIGQVSDIIQQGLPLAFRVQMVQAVSNGATRSSQEKPTLGKSSSTHLYQQHENQPSLLTYLSKNHTRVISLL